MTDQLGALTTIFTEFYYWVTVVLMFLIHVGFCMYEVGASRYKQKNKKKPSMETGFFNLLSTTDCVIKILSKLFSNQQEDVLETFEI